MKSLQMVVVGRKKGESMTTSHKPLTINKDHTNHTNAAGHKGECSDE